MGDNVTLSDWQNKAGYLFILQGVVYLTPYVPCAIVMAGESYRRHSGYKFMLAMAAIDILQIAMGSFLYGILSIVGCPEETNYSFLKTQGALANMLWYAYGLVNIALAINRLTELAASNLSQRLFKGYLGVPGTYGSLGPCSDDHPELSLVTWPLGWRTVVWIAACFLLAAPIFCVFNGEIATISYHSGYGLLMFDIKTYGVMINLFFNIFVSVTLPILYFFVCLSLRHLVRDMDTDGAAEKERSVVIQSILISGMTALVAISYVTAPLLINDISTFIVLTFLWQAMQGGNCFIYLAMNKSLRGSVAELVWKRKVEEKVTTRVFTITNKPRTDSIPNQA